MRFRIWSRLVGGEGPCDVVVVVGTYTDIQRGWVGVRRMKGKKKREGGDALETHI